MHYEKKISQLKTDIFNDFNSLFDGIFNVEGYSVDFGLYPFFSNANHLFELQIRLEKLNLKPNLNIEHLDRIDHIDMYFNFDKENVKIDYALYFEERELEDTNLYLSFDRIFKDILLSKKDKINNLSTKNEISFGKTELLPDIHHFSSLYFKYLAWNAFGKVEISEEYLDILHSKIKYDFLFEKSNRFVSDYQKKIERIKSFKNAVLFSEFSACKKINKDIFQHMLELIELNYAK
jgi:hypothetical protein